MDCKTFQKLLPAFLAAELEPDDFERMVAHEADCESCHTLAAERMSDPAGSSNDEQWVRETLVRTVGSDCTYIELQLAAALDAARPADTPEIVREHVKACPHCQAIASVLNTLPDYYAAVPRLHADASFARDVLARTWGPKASFREVVRALLARSSLLWEGAVICALLVTPLAGNQSLKVIHSLQRVGTSAQEQLAVDNLRPTVPEEVDDLGAQVIAFRDRQVQAIEREWLAARDRIGDSLGAVIDERPGENASVAVVRSFARHTLGELGLVNPAPSLPEGSLSPTDSHSPSAGDGSTEID